ncbi:MAG: hypothetical protein HN955_06340 [Prolixibacteraceae bacterium]|jgi:hypothetical protein|nr:hypothetical protein [Prolixibacteraceae bacterium]MBT6765814.1 hypothetical protein [Prolixibacteraceae bacterium]MBT6998048.1 hypothetical protein [Prolixibacteraceae bacterium]
MNRILNQKNLIIGLVLLVASHSCSKEKEGTTFEAVGDVYYINKIIDNEKVTALSFYAYGNKAITSAIVSLPDGGSVRLDESLESSFTVFSEPVENDFNPNYQEEGNYIFDLESNDGDKLQSSDLLEIENLEIPVITEIRYEEIDFSYDVEWNQIDNADAYLFKMLDHEGEIVFTGNLMESGERAFTLIQNDMGTWEKEVVLGNIYTLQLFAFIYDAEAEATATGTANSPMFNLQEISICETDFVWDEE